MKIYKRCELNNEINNKSKWKDHFSKLISLILLLSFVFSFSLSANLLSLQGTKISITYSDVPLSRIISEIEKQSGYSIIVRLNDIDVNEKYSIDEIDSDMSQVLAGLFEGKNVSYELKGKTLSIYKAKKAPVDTSVSTQDKRQIEGVVTDINGEPLVGVNVLEKGTNNGVITDIEGGFTLYVGEGAILTLTYLGYLPQEIPIKTQTSISVVLIEDVQTLEEVVVVGYGTQKKGNLTGSVASINSKDISVAPIASTSNALAGRLPGLVSLQSSGLPGEDAAKISIRGFGNPLVIVDGIQSSFDNIDANQIESISILKDGSASIYGARAGNGVVLITTKRGVVGKPTISLNVTGTLQGVTIMPKPVSAGQYAEMRAEEHMQAERPLSEIPFTQEQIEKYYQGTDPLYPNTNWYKELMRPWAPQQQYNLSIRGGNDDIKYYGFLGYLDQSTMIKNNGGGYKRYNFQSNIDAKILDNLSLELTISSVIEDLNRTQRSLSNSGGFWEDYWGTLPIYPARLPDPSKVSYAYGAGTGGAHVTSNRSLSGYNDADKQNIKGTMSINYRAKYIDGLSLKLFLNYGKDYISNKHFSKPVNLYTYDPESQIYSLAGNYNSKAQLTEYRSENQVLTGYFSVNYDKRFLEKHHLTVMALYEAINSSSNWINAKRDNYMSSSIDQLFAGSNSGMSNDGRKFEDGRVSYLGRLNYSYMDKYILETIFRIDGSARYRSDQRWGYFPSFSLGWRISEENFLKNVEAINNLKLRASYGESGDDSVASFQFLSGYSIASPYILGNSPQVGLISTGIANPFLTWEEMKIANLGLDFSLFNQQLYGEFDVFYRERSGMATSRLNTLPSSFGASLPDENLQSQSDRGFELSLGTSQKFNDLSIDLSGNISWSRTKWKHYEEPDYSDPDQVRLMKRSGKWTDKIYGYKSDGLFTSQEQIDNLTFDMDYKGNSTIRPGDIRYINTNGDDVLDWRDQVEIGSGDTPHWMFGFTLNVEYKNFDLSSLFQGAFGYNKLINLRYGELYPEAIYDLRWTTENNDPNAIVPRLGGAATNGYTSDYNYKKAGYLRLKTLSVGYTLPKSLAGKAGLERARIYFAGTNLFTIDRLKKYGIDPESPSGISGAYYPQQRTITLGLNLSF